LLNLTNSEEFASFCSISLLLRRVTITVSGGNRILGEGGTQAVEKMLIQPFGVDGQSHSLLVASGNCRESSDFSFSESSRNKFSFVGGCKSLPFPCGRLAKSFDLTRFAIRNCITKNLTVSDRSLPKCTFPKENAETL